MITINGKNLYSTKEIQKKLHLSQSTIKKYREEGRLIGKRHGKSYYYSEEAILKYYESFNGEDP